jgi:hypothetical protein
MGLVSDSRPLLIVGHGPSALCGRGSVIDQYRVVRLKKGLTPDMPREHFGTRTDVICGRSNIYRQEGVEFWTFPDDSPWIEYYRQFDPKIWKPSHGLSAVMCAIDRVQPKAITLIGFDRILYQDDVRSKKWNTAGRPSPHAWPHDQRAEYECLFSLGVEIIDLARANGEVPGL